MKTTSYIEMDGKRVLVADALELMTDEWIDGGNYCAQTVINLRDVCQEQQMAIEYLDSEIAKLKAKL